MFRKSDPEKQMDIFGGVPSLLGGKPLTQYTNPHAWHNQFRIHVLSRIDEDLFKVLYSPTMGAPNASVSVLVGMMILKEAFGWSDAQLFEHCRFNLLIRSALGLFNLTDEVPTESTYYLFRKQVYTYAREQGEDLLEKAYERVTQGQVKDFEVSGKSIRMDSTLFGSNIAWYSRYQIIHQTLVRFCKTQEESSFSTFSENDRQQFKELLTEEPLKTVYHSTKEDIHARMHTIGRLAYLVVGRFSDTKSETYEVLVRVFHEQYRVEGEQEKVVLRPQEKLLSGSVQSPHDPDSAYRKKGSKQVKGYSINVTETNSEGQLNLITDVSVDKANVADTHFVEPSIEATKKVTGQTVEKVYADGAYQSPDHDEYCKEIDMVYTGMQGAAPRYDLEMTDQGLKVTDTQTGECVEAKRAKKTKRSKEDIWVIRKGKKRVYFGEQAIRACALRRTIKQRPKEETQKRNNVEATIFHVGYTLRKGKSKYRGLIKNQLWATCRCLWVNLVRIVNYVVEKSQDPSHPSKKRTFSSDLRAQIVFTYGMNYLFSPPISIFEFNHDF